MRGGAGGGGEERRELRREGRGERERGGARGQRARSIGLESISENDPRARWLLTEKGHRPVKKRKDSSRRVPDILQSEKDDFRVSASARRDRASAVRVRAPRRVLVLESSYTTAEIDPPYARRFSIAATRAGQKPDRRSGTGTTRRDRKSRRSRGIIGPRRGAPGAVAAREATLAAREPTDLGGDKNHPRDGAAKTIVEDARRATPARASEIQPTTARRKNKQSARRVLDHGNARGAGGRRGKTDRRRAHLPKAGGGRERAGERAVKLAS